MSTSAVPILEGSPDLPIELWLEILGRDSSYFDLCRVRCVSRAFNALVSSPAFDHKLFRTATDTEKMARFAAAHPDEWLYEHFDLHPLFFLSTRPTLTATLEEIVVEPPAADGKPRSLVSIGPAVEEQATEPPITRAVVAYKIDLPMPELEIAPTTGITVRQVFEAWHDLTAQPVPQGVTVLCDGCQAEHEISSGMTWGEHAIADALDGGASGNDPDDVWVPAAELFPRESSLAVFCMMQLWQFER